MKEANVGLSLAAIKAAAVFLRTKLLEKKHSYVDFFFLLSLALLPWYLGIPMYIVGWFITDYLDREFA